MGCAVSVVIPTYNRKARLGRVLQALTEQSGLSPSPGEAFEVVVIDDGSTDGTAAWLREQRFPFAIAVLEQANQGPAAARNAGVERASAALILFLDDDVVPGPDLVAEHLKMHAAEVDIVVTGPMASLSSYRQPWVAWEQAKLEGQYAAMIRGDYEPTFRQFWTGNASLAKSHFVAAGGFDRSFPRGEDIELGQRLAARGLRFRFNPRARGLHHAERSLESWSSMHRHYGRLEVQIFQRLGEETFERVLSDNYARLHPLNRWLVRGCVGRELPSKAATKALGGVLRLSAGLASVSGVGGAVSNAACGALANLLYWDASAEALGDTAARRVFGRKPRTR